MTHEELLQVIDVYNDGKGDAFAIALRAVVELHKPMWNGEYCGECHPDHNGSYPCSTIQAVEKELN